MTRMRTRPLSDHSEPYIRGVNPVRDCVHLRTKCQILADNLATSRESIDMFSNGVN